MPDASAVDLVPTESGAEPARWSRAGGRLAERVGAGVEPVRDRVRGLLGAVRRRVPERYGALLRPLAGWWPPASAGDLLVAVPLLIEPALVSWSGFGRIAVAALAFGLLSGAAGGLSQLVVDAWTERGRRPGAPATSATPVTPAAARRWVWSRSLGWLAAGLAAALTLGVGTATVAVAFVAVQGCRASAGRRAPALGVLTVALAIVLRIDAGAVALGTAPRSPVLLLAALFGLFAGLCQHRERLLTGSPSTPRRVVELARRYIDVAIAALLCGLIVAYVLVLGQDPVIRATLGARAYLSAPFVLGGLLRCWHVAVVEERPIPRGRLLFADPWLAVGALGGAATLGLVPYL